jgi:hypothetical protein
LEKSSPYLFLLFSCRVLCKIYVSWLCTREWSRVPGGGVHRSNLEWDATKYLSIPYCTLLYLIVPCRTWLYLNVSYCALLFLIYLIVLHCTMLNLIVSCCTALYSCLHFVSRVLKIPRARIFYDSPVHV